MAANDYNGPTSDQNPVQPVPTSAVKSQEDAGFTQALVQVCYRYQRQIAGPDRVAVNNWYSAGLPA